MPDIVPISPEPENVPDIPVSSVGLVLDVMASQKLLISFAHRSPPNKMSPDITPMRYIKIVISSIGSSSSLFKNSQNDSPPFLIHMCYIGGWLPFLKLSNPPATRSRGQEIKKL